VVGSVVLIFGGAGVSFLIFLDHPHRREVALAEECERVANGAPRSSSLPRLGHALFLSGLVLGACALLVYFLDHANAWKQLHWGWVAVVVAGPALGVMLFSLAIEAAFVAFESGWARWTATVIAAGLILTCFVTPAVDCAGSHYRWRRSLSVSRDYYIRLGEGNPSAVRHGPGQMLGYFRQMQSYAVYLNEMNSLGDVHRQEREFGDAPLKFFWHYHPTACTVYVAVLLAVCGALVFWRAWTYRALRRRAERVTEARTAA
jgi:hypothetical protein